MSSAECKNGCQAYYVSAIIDACKEFRACLSKPGGKKNFAECEKEFNGAMETANKVYETCIKYCSFKLPNL